MLPLSSRQSCAALAVGLVSLGSRSSAQEALDVHRYVEIVLAAHPAAAETAGLESAAAAESKAARLFPDPVLEYSRDRGRLTDVSGLEATETEWSVSQTIPWPGTFSAGVRAGDRAADAFRAGAEALRWELAARARLAFARLVAARSLVEVARPAEEDARSLRDLVTRRAELGEARESDRIKAEVEWLRQQRRVAAAARGAAAAEAAVRALAVRPLPIPLAIRQAAHAPIRDLDRESLVADLVSRSPRLRAARAEAERQEALASVARRGRIPDLDVTLFKSREIDKQATGVSLGVTVPLWNAGRGEVARAEAAARVGAAAAERARVDLVAEAAALIEELQVAAAQAALLDSEIVPAAERSVGLVRLSFEEGETSLLDLLDAQRTWRDAQREAVEAHLGLSVALAEVQRLAGPGFDPWR
jgi:cobalt-zinc-cadmium efflux system outer membrane protein